MIKTPAFTNEQAPTNSVCRLLLSDLISGSARFLPQRKGQTIVSTDKAWKPLTRPSPIPEIPVPARHPPPARDHRGRWLESGNLAGRTSASKRRLTQVRSRREFLYRPLPPTLQTQPHPVKNTPGMTGVELAKLASLAYGHGWQTAIARDLMLSRETVCRWASGRFQISDEHALEIALVCLARARQNLAAAKKAYRIRQRTC